MKLTVEQVDPDITLTITEAGPGLTFSDPTAAQFVGGSIITVAIPGAIAGPAGKDGLNGTPGQTFVYDQSIASDVWSIPHNLGVYPAVTVIDSAGSLIEGDVRYDNNNHVTLMFSAAFAGIASLI